MQSTFFIPHNTIKTVRSTHSTTEEHLQNETSNESLASHQAGVRRHTWAGNATHSSKDPPSRGDRTLPAPNEAKQGQKPRPASPAMPRRRRRATWTTFPFSSVCVIARGGQPRAKTNKCANTHVIPEIKASPTRPTVNFVHASSKRSCKNEGSVDSLNLASIHAVAVKTPVYCLRINDVSEELYQILEAISDSVLLSTERSSSPQPNVSRRHRVPNSVNIGRCSLLL